MALALTITAAVIAFAALAFATLLLIQRPILYPCRFRRTPTDAELPAGAQRLWIAHDQGRTPADFYPAEGVDGPAPVIVFAHGNGDLIEDYARGGRAGLLGYRRRGYATLLVEYRGCGAADGSATMPHILADHLAFVDLIARRPDIDADRIVYHGRSMGGGIAAEMTRRRPPAALVLESTYTGITGFSRKLHIPDALVLDPWEVTGPLRDYAARGGPVLISHAEDDGIIPYAMAETNRAAAPGHAFWKSNRRHVDFMPDAFFAFVTDWLDRSLPPTPARREATGAVASTPANAPA